MKYFPFKYTTIALALLMIFLASFATADQRTDTGIYVGGGIGVSNIDSNLDLDKDSGTIPRIAAGWQVTPSWGVEAAYYNFLEFKDPIATLAKYDVSGLSVAGTLRIPLSTRVAIFAKLGQIWWSTDLFDTTCSRGPSGCSTTKFDVSETDTFLGLGLGYELTERFELELEYDYFDFNFEGNLDIFSNETSMIAFSLKFNF